MVLGIFILFGVGGINAIDLGGLNQRITGHFHGAKGRRRVCGKKRIAGAGGKNDNAALFHMADGAAADIGFADRGHGNGGLDAGLHPVGL